jgi:hypothetical protein
VLIRAEDWGMSRELVRNYRDLEVYQAAFSAAMNIFEASKKFPTEERYSLTDPSGSAVAHGGNPQDRAASPNAKIFSICMC